MNLSLLRILLGQTYSHEVCIEIVSETARLFRQEASPRWYFLLLNRIFVYIIAHPDDLKDADTVEPTLRALSISAALGIDAIEQQDQDELILAANGLAAAYARLC